ncbi:MAG: hypothetical protein IIT59_05895 [Rhodocyclaceae bacterium]|nr:hypothetical protein [Rhodocyclaceae bacterium]
MLKLHGTRLRKKRQFYWQERIHPNPQKRPAQTVGFPLDVVFINEDKEEVRTKTVEKWGRCIKNKEKRLWENLWADGGRAVAQMWDKILGKGKMQVIHKPSPNHPAVFPSVPEGGGNKSHAVQLYRNFLQGGR